MSDADPILTPEQVDTLRQLAGGMTATQIAARGNLATTAVRMRVARAGERLGLSVGATTVQVTVEAALRGLLAEPQSYAPVPPGSWRGVADHTLVVEGTNGDDTAVVMWVAAPHDGPGVTLTADQAREIGWSLIQRAALITTRPRQPIGERA